MLRKTGTAVILICFIFLVSTTNFAARDNSSSPPKTTEEVTALINGSYMDLFEKIDENFQVNQSVLQKVKENISEQSAKDLTTIETKISTLENQAETIRKEQKKLNERISKSTVRLARLKKEQEKNASSTNDEAETEKIREEISLDQKRNQELERQLVGDSNFNFAQAEEQLDALRDSLLLETSPPERKTLEEAIAKIEEKIQAATGLQGHIRDAKKEKYNIEAKNSHRQAKLESLERWPNKLKKVNETILANQQDERRHGDIENIGNLEARKLHKIKVLKILPGMISMQSEIQMGQGIAEELINNGQIQLHNNPLITDFIERVGQLIVRNSDAWCPFKFYVIADSPDKHEINAFALPGGQVFINDSLILAMATEGEFAGVLAHEIAHDNARHAVKRLSKMQYMQYGAMAGVIFGGVGYWGYQGLGIALNIGALGITRESETEADQLGTQYLWKAGYDPRLLINSFDRLLQDQKLGSSAFWKTHPSLDDRMEHVETEFLYLPPKDLYKVTGPEYLAVQKAILKERIVLGQLQSEERAGRPTLEKRKKQAPPKMPPDENPDKENRPVLKRPAPQN